MKYYVIEIQTPVEGNESKAIYSYDTYDEALKIFHQKMASGITAGLAGTIKDTLVEIINGVGNVEQLGRWVAPITPEEVEEG